jgi:hypothetical protein
MTAEQEFERSIERELRRARVAYVKKPIVGNTRPDFLVTTPAGDRIIIEAKAWPSSRQNSARAAHQARRYAQLSKVVGALIITPHSVVFCSADGDVSPVPDLQTALANFSTAPTSAQKPKLSSKQRSTRIKRVFASMPFASKYDDTYLVAIQPAALALKATADKVDHTGSAGEVVGQVKAMIKRAKVVIADLSGSRPNVCHEVGYAEALQRPVIQICSTPVDRLPFNLRNNQTITYSLGQTTALKIHLQRELARLL